jgi:tetratricopeptide (TPR) repeat protein
MTTLRLTCFAALLIALLPSLPAHALDKRAASAHFQRGRALFDGGSWSAALDEFNAGYDAYPLPGFLVNIGQCQRKLERLDEAAASFQKFLDSGTGDARLRTEVEEALREISDERGRRQAAVDAEAEARRRRDEADARRQRDEAEARRQRDESERRRADVERAHTALAASAAPLVAPAAVVATGPAPAAVEKPKSRKWVWAVVAVLAAGAVGAAVGVGVLETQPQAPHPGSLGLLDGRR